MEWNQKNNIIISKAYLTRWLTLRLELFEAFQLLSQTFIIQRVLTFSRVFSDQKRLNLKKTSSAHGWVNRITYVNRHGLIVEKYGAALQEMRLAINPGLNCTIVSSHCLFITWIFISVVSWYLCSRNLILGSCIIYLFKLRVHLVRLITS